MAKAREAFRVADDIYMVVKEFGEPLAQPTDNGPPRSFAMKSARIIDQSHGLRRQFLIQAHNFEAVFETWRGSSPQVIISDGKPEDLERVYEDVQREAKIITATRLLNSLK